MEYVDDFCVVVFWVSVCVLAVLVDDFVGFLEDFGSGCGTIFWCGCHIVLVYLLRDCCGWFLKISRGCHRFFRGVRVVVLLG